LIQLGGAGGFACGCHGLPDQSSERLLKRAKSDSQVWDQVWDLRHDNRGVWLALLLASSALAPIHIEYPATGAVFPPEITAPTFLWHDGAKTATTWRVDISFSDGSPTLHSTAKGERLRVGPIDPD
jgi:hypothetical protein